jgi:ATP-dependent DNA helicase RecG
MSEDRLRAIFAEGQPDWFSLPAKFDCDDDAVVRLLDTQSYFGFIRLKRMVSLGHKWRRRRVG